MNGGEQILSSVKRKKNGQKEKRKNPLDELMNSLLHYTKHKENKMLCSASAWMCVLARADVTLSHPHETTINCLFWKLLSHHIASLSSLFTLVAVKQWPYSTEPWLFLNNTGASQQAECKLSHRFKALFENTVLSLFCILLALWQELKEWINICKCLLNKIQYTDY